jgi:protein-S-isoprenylcysteine O-methyltransferase Ste14
MHRWANGKPPAPPHLETRSLYRWLQHPMYIGVLIGLWCTPRMTLGHLMLAGGLTIYLLIGMRFERRDLERRFGARYKLWRSDG